MQKKTQIRLACFLAGTICLLVVQAVFILLWPAFVAAGLLHNFGMMMPSPTTQFSTSEVLFLRMMASASAVVILGPTLVLFPGRAWVSLFGLVLPWALMAALGMESPSFPGGFLARLFNGSAFITLGLLEWTLCVGICWLLRRLPFFRQLTNDPQTGILSL